MDIESLVRKINKKLGPGIELQRTERGYRCVDTYLDLLVEERVDVQRVAIELGVLPSNGKWHRAL